MFKLIVLVAMIVASQAMPEMAGGWTSQTTIDDHIMDLARWTTSQLSGYTGIQGDHNVMTVRNVQTQIVSGVNYKFTVDVLIHGADNRYSVSSSLISLKY